MFALCFGGCIDKSMWYNFPTYGKALNSKETQLRKDKKQPRNFTGGTERIAYLTFIMWFPQGS